MSKKKKAKKKKRKPRLDMNQLGKSIVDQATRPGPKGKRKC